ncbi:MAG: thioredoxin family protein [Mollicutes bacterium]|nr:thioredoxin family protein [Mollicutes bacterium]MDY5875651.1 thioredoxin family protein [Bacilli bacterium]
MQEIRKINDFYEMIEHDKVLVIFYADWSGPADILLQVTEDLKEELKSYEVVKVNTDKLMQITRKYHITSVPALKVFKNGKITLESSGVKTREELSKLLAEN